MKMKFLHVFNSSQINNFLCIEYVFPSLSKRPQAAIGSAVGLWYTRVPRQGSENQLLNLSKTETEEINFTCNLPEMREMLHLSLP